MALKGKNTSIETAILDKQIPWDHRRQLLAGLCMDDDAECHAALERILSAAASASTKSIYQKKCEEVTEIIQQLQEGPLRSATFFRTLSEPNGSGKHHAEQYAKQPGRPGTKPGPRRAHVLLEDGTGVYPLLIDEKLQKSLRCGDPVLLDAQGKVVLFRGAEGPEFGEEARLERRIGEQRVEICLHDYEKYVYAAAQKLIDAMNADEARPGDVVLVCRRRMIAHEAVPREDRLSHYRFLRREQVPDVLVDRDIGAPSAFLEELSNHIYLEMTRPELARRYRLARCRTKLLVGVSGSGKTLSIQAMWRRMYEVMSTATGVPIEELPPRVLHLRSSSVLSKWYSESEKLLDGFFDEVEQLAGETIVAADGRQYELPVLVIGEEADALARTRGGDPVHDRVQTTLLQRLDATSQKLRDHLIVYLFTSNVPELVDPAFLRRAGGTMVRFSRLGRHGCGEVLDKHLRDLPLEVDGDTVNGEAACQRVKADILPWLYSPNGEDQGVLEVTYVGATAPEIKYRRDFLNGALIARAVEEAAEKACWDEWHQDRASGVTSQRIMAALASQVQSIVDQLDAANLHHYVTLPDGVRVSNLRRIAQPQMRSFELTRSAQ